MNGSLNILDLDPPLLTPQHFLNLVVGLLGVVHWETMCSC